VVFRQRDVLQTDPRMLNVQWKFTDNDDYGADFVCYGDLQLAVDDSTIVNQAQITPAGQPTATATDSASMAHYGPMTWTRTDLPIISDTEALSTAQLVVLEYAEDNKRVEALTFDALHHGLYHTYAAQGMHINDRIHVARTLPGTYSGSSPVRPGPQLIDTELLVQGIHHEILPLGEIDGDVPRIGSWIVTLKTASATLVRDFGRWDQDPVGPPAAGWDVSVWAL
jgi:hypothetical protein